MGLISRSSFSDSQVPTAAGFNLPLDTIYNEFNGNIDSNNIKTGGILAANLATSINPVTLRREMLGNFVYTGGTIATSANLSTTIIAGTAYVNGQRLIWSNTPITVTASKDTYIYLKDDGTFITTNNVTNNTTSPSATTNADGTTSLLLGILVSSGTAITSVNQGSPSAAAPVVSSVTYAVCDGNGNLIFPTAPTPIMIGYRQITTAFTTASGTAVQATGLSAPVIIPAGRRAEIVVYAGSVYSTSNTTNVVVTLWDGTVGSGTQIAQSVVAMAAAAQQIPLFMSAIVAPATSSKTYNVGVHVSGGTANFTASSTAPAFISAKLV